VPLKLDVHDSLFILFSVSGEKKSVVLESRLMLGSVCLKRNKTGEHLLMCKNSVPSSGKSSELYKLGHDVNSV
jgi:hypothetical protein